MNTKLLGGILIVIIIVIVAAYFKTNLATDSSNVIPAPQVKNTAIPQKRSDWKTYSFKEIGLTFQAPEDITVTMENVDNLSKTYNLFIQRGSMQENNYYQLYGIYRTAKDTKFAEQDLENFKKELDPAYIKETSIDGYKAVEGQVKGERNRFVTYILKRNELFTLYTSQPTKENKALTDHILATFDFK